MTGCLDFLQNNTGGSHSGKVVLLPLNSKWQNWGLERLVPQPGSAGRALEPRECVFRASKPWVPGKTLSQRLHWPLPQVTRCWKPTQKVTLTEFHNSISRAYPTLCDPMDCSLPGSSVHGIFQARLLEWVAMPSSRGSSRARDSTHVFCVSCIAGGFVTLWDIGGVPILPRKQTQIRSLSETGMFLLWKWKTVVWFSLQLPSPERWCRISAECDPHLSCHRRLATPSGRHAALSKVRESLACGHTQASEGEGKSAWQPNPPRSPSGHRAAWRWTRPLTLRIPDTVMKNVVSAFFYRKAQKVPHQSSALHPTWSDFEGRAFQK